MKTTLLAFLLVIVSYCVNAQCTTTNATSCQCKTTGQTDCDLLPDIQIGHPPFYVYDHDFGVKEFSQSGNPDTADDGKLYVTVSTPNTGHGPLEIYTTNTFICGTDTFNGSAPSICPDGITLPRVLIMQRIYHKSGNVMSSYSRPAGTMTYHPGHSHMHVDNWGNYSLRIRDTLEPNPLNWPLVGAGTKLAFCVMDYGDCPGYADHCLDSAGNSLNNSSDFPNYGLGGGNYSCSPSMQGISSGYVDIYWTTLEGMYLEIPPGTCNGDYYIVCEVDPNNNFLEENENNNVYAAPYRLKKQTLNPATEKINVSISSTGVNICPGEIVSLAAQVNFTGATYLWNTGDTNQFIFVNTGGIYSAGITNVCGTGTSLPVEINLIQPVPPTGVNDTIPSPGSAVLVATSAFPVSWYSTPAGGSVIFTGDTFTTPVINATTTFYAETEETVAGAIFHTGLPTNTAGGSGGYSGASQSLIFDCINAFTLKSVNVYSQSGGNINVELTDSSGNLLQSFPASLVSGMNVVNVGFNITPGKNYMLTRTGDNVYRNNPGSNIGYPIEVPNYCSITGSTAGPEFYYFFYDWVLTLPDKSCISPRTPVTAVLGSTTGISDMLHLSGLQVFPNPANDVLHVSFLSDELQNIVVMDLHGRRILEATSYPTSEIRDVKFDVSGFSSGMYVVHIFSREKNVYRRVMIN